MPARLFATSRRVYVAVALVIGALMCPACAVGEEGEATAGGSWPAWLKAGSKVSFVFDKVNALCTRGCADDDEQPCIKQEMKNGEKYRFTCQNLLQAAPSDTERGGETWEVTSLSAGSEADQVLVSFKHVGSGKWCSITSCCSQEIDCNTDSDPGPAFELKHIQQIDASSSKMAFVDASTGKIGKDKNENRIRMRNSASQAHNENYYKNSFTIRNLDPVVDGEAAVNPNACGEEVMELAQKFAASSMNDELMETGLGFDTRTFGGYIAAGDVAVDDSIHETWSTKSEFFMDAVQKFPFYIYGEKTQNGAKWTVTNSGKFIRLGLLRKMGMTSVYVGYNPRIAVAPAGDSKGDQTSQIKFEDDEFQNKQGETDYNYEVDADEIGLGVSTFQRLVDKYDQKVMTSPRYADWRGMWNAAVISTLDESDYDLNVGAADVTTHFNSVESAFTATEQKTALAELYSGDPILKDVSVMIYNESSMTISRRFGEDTCSSSVYLEARICSGCKCQCTENGPKETYATSTLQHSTTMSSARGEQCDAWFLRLDATLRAYTSALRSSLMSNRAACCAKWTADKTEALHQTFIGGGYEYGRIFPGSAGGIATCNGKTGSGYWDIVAGRNTFITSDQEYGSDSSYPPGMTLQTQRRESLGAAENAKSSSVMAVGMTVALIGPRQGKYCKDKGTGGRAGIQCNSDEATEFTVVHKSSTKVGIKSADSSNKYCGDKGNTVMCNKNKIGGKESFEIIDTGDGTTVGIKGGRYNKYCEDSSSGKWVCNKNSIDDANVKFTVQCLSGGCPTAAAPNECQCTNGTPVASADCPSDGATSCASCEAGFYVGSTNSCEPNQCECPNGTGKSGPDCASNADAGCESCDVGFEIATNCASCSDGYHGTDCSPDQCECPHGTPATGMACPSHGTVKCSSCNEGFELNGGSCATVAVVEDVVNEVESVVDSLVDSIVDSTTQQTASTGIPSWQGCESGVHTNADGTPNSEGIYCDVTSEYISRLHQSCTHHVFASTDAMLHPLWGSANLCADDLAGQCTTGAEIGPPSALAYKITCADLNYSNKKRLAFSPLLADKYFPPWISSVDTNRDRGSRYDADGTHTVELSCGGQELWLKPWTSKGFQFDWKHASSTGWSFSDSELSNEGSFHDIAGGFQSRSSSTCCPPLSGATEFNSKTDDYTKGSMYTRVGGEGIHNGDNGRAKTLPTTVDARACFREKFGDTLSCKSEFNVKILMCNDCDCPTSNGDGKNLVVVHTNHTMASDTPGCKPWFSLSDTGIRSLVGDIRREVNQAKRAACPAGSSTKF